MTEHAGCVVEGDPAGGNELLDGPAGVGGTVGPALPGVGVRVVDDEGTRLAVGEIGHVQVRGPNVFSGYWRMPEKTKEELRADGFFITGDLGKIDAKGYVHIVGRGKDLVISGGYNVYPKEVETEIDSIDGVIESAVIGVPDSGGHLPLGRHELVLLPAHFMHSEGNFHFYDPVSKILFTGDLGVSMMSGAEASRPVTDLLAHIPRMEGFHRRYMVSNKILRLWVNMARQLDIAMIVPQHGAPIMGKPAIQDFCAWIENLKCGIDLFDDRAYQVPTAHIDPVTRQMRPALRQVG